jgi:hypothetical protein
MSTTLSGTSTAAYAASELCLKSSITSCSPLLLLAPLPLLLGLLSAGRPAARRASLPTCAFDTCVLLMREQRRRARLLAGS